MEAVEFGWSGTDGARAGCVARSGTEELGEIQRAVPAVPARRAFLRWRLPAPPYFFFFLLPDLLGRYSLEHP